MLTLLKVKNYALISDAELRFEGGMNIITGETGAGKSILLGALGLTLGNRADTSVLRNKDGKCVIEAHFKVDKLGLKPFFEANDLDYEQTTIFRREITSSGKSRAFINDTPVKLKLLEEVGNGLIEIHSQHDNLQLFKLESQFSCLDALVGVMPEREQFTALYSERSAAWSRLESLKNRQAELKREQEFNQFMFDELDSANLGQVNEEELNSELDLLENAEELIRSFQEADQLFQGSEYSILPLLQNLKQILRSNGSSMTQELADRVNAVVVELQDVASEINTAADRVEVNPERLDEVNERLAVLFNLKSKHNAQSLEDLLAVKEEIEKRLETTASVNDEIAALEEELAALDNDLNARASRLSKARLEGKTKVEEAMNQRLSKLGMQHSSVQFSLSNRAELNRYGNQDLLLLLSSDKGATYNDIRRSASGGELGRINLSFKHLMAASGNQYLATSIFDEIDTGVSGEIARKVGVMMHEMGEDQQVVVVTHLAQIASLGSNHLFVYKTEQDGKVITSVKPIAGDERINEIAKMISGDNLTEHALKQSRSLLQN